MMESQVARFERMIREKLPTHESAEHAARSVKEDFESFAGPIPADRERELTAALERIKRSFANARVEILRRSNSLISQHENWYTGPSPRDRHWPALKGYLENTKGWEHESIDSIDTSSTEVVSCLANPATDQFHYRGLVVGYVQSGKTANMTAVIAKAVDAGYNFIVLLGGITNKLRAQTQRRIEGDIVNRHKTFWRIYTSEDEDTGDFVVPPDGQFEMPGGGRAQLAIIKKETRRLKKFLHVLEKTPLHVRRSMKVLVIDDECDQASVDSSGRHEDPKPINDKIRRILRGLPAVSYVGYTATPFANVFINPFTDSDNTPDDLYPRDFITALPKPLEYFGAREVFGFEPDDADNPDTASWGLDLVRVINTAELAKLRSTAKKNRKSFVPTVTLSLEQAIVWFLLACAVRRQRGQANAHMTMLVHASQYINQHEQMAEAIQEWLNQHHKQIVEARGPAWEQLEEVWADEVSRVPLSTLGDDTLSPKNLHPYLCETLESLQVVVENSQSDERLAYGEDARTYIVVGGSVLARGLTLEGLMVSFFLRTSLQYDTLLQMGRWFGFRKGYADLPRLWTTKKLISNFRALSRIENEIRDDIGIYRNNNATPLDFAVRVRSIPGLAITSAGKMRHAYRASIDFSGKHVQTIWFDHLDREAVARNWSAASQLVDAAKANYDKDNGYFQGIPAPEIRKFLRSYSICDQHLDLKQEMLLGYLDKTSDKFDLWNVAIISPSNGSMSRKELGFLGQVKTNRRSKLNEPRTQAYIKALMSKNDILVDIEDRHNVDAKKDWESLKLHRPTRPLLLLYPIEAQSAPKHESKARTSLAAVDDLIGLGIVFPGTKDRAGGFYSVELDVPTPEQLDEDEEGEPGDE